MNGSSCSRDKMTVDELCAEVQVSRSTFYGRR